MADMNPLTPPTIRPASLPGSLESKNAAEKIAKGWAETAKDLPAEAVDKLKRTAHAALNPIDTAKAYVEKVKADPKRALLPLAMMAGGAALSIVSPGLMRYVGYGMTASMFVIPSVKFAKAKTEDELETIADGASKQLVDTAASYATSWAAGAVVKKSLDLYKARKASVGTASAPKGLTAEQVGKVELKADGKSGVKLADGGDWPTDPDAINYRAFRTNKEAGHQFVTEIRGKVADFHFERIKKQQPDLTRAAFDKLLQTPEARDLRLQMVQDVRGVVHAQNLQLHGVKVPEGMAVGDMAGVRKYLQTVDSTYDIADAVKGVNAGIAKNVQGAPKLALEGEKMLFTERGVPASAFGQLEKSGLGAEDLKKLRKFADSFSDQQSGKYLQVAAKAAGKEGSVDALRSVMTRQLASDVGVVVPQGSPVTDRTLLTLTYGLGNEHPGTAKAMVDTINAQLKAGKTEYYDIAQAMNTDMLKGLGAEAALKKLDLPDAQIAKAAPDYPPALIRADQTKLLRDRLRGLPEAQRAEALQALQTGKASLLDFDAALKPVFEGQLKKLTGADAELVAYMTQNMTPQHRANLVTSLAKLPDDVRAQAFAGLKGDAASRYAQVVDRLVSATEGRYGVVMHREKGVFPIQNWGEDAAVQDWSIHGASELHGAMARMAKDGKLPESVKGTTYISLHNGQPLIGERAAQAVASVQPPRATSKFAAAETPDVYADASLVPFTMGAPRGRKPLLYYAPGSDGYAGGTMGYRTDVDGKEFVALYDASLAMHNSREVAGSTKPFGTLVHESGHAIQMGGELGVPTAQQIAQEKRLVSEWSTLSNWREPDGSLADGYRMVGGRESRYYKDPAVQVSDRRAIVTSYAATDSVEDFAEYSRIFYTDPATALRVSPEKFLYTNQLVGGRYSADQAAALAQGVGLEPSALQAALASMRAKLGAVPGAAVQAKPGLLERAKGALAGLLKP